MPIRSRDFILYILVLLFLLIGIGTTLLREQSNATQTGVPFSADAVDMHASSSYEATVLQRAEIDRAAQIARLRAEIAAMEDQYIVEPEVTEVEVDDDEEVATSTQERYGVRVCTNIQPVNTNWSPSDVEMVAGEGVRMYTRVGTGDGVMASSSKLVRETLLQLPLSPQRSADPNCIPQPVVGIALDGSLIRNDETGLYSIFGGATLIGYALDGHALYGQSDDVETDQCGGALIAGEYRYYLSTDRETIINCYAAPPQRL